MYTVAPKQSFISRGKSGGPGLFTPQPKCPASRAFLMPGTVCIPITVHVCPDRVPHLGWEFTTMFQAIRKENAGERSNGFSCRFSHDDGCCTSCPSIS